MAGFSLDDVRDTFSADISRLLENIELAARTMAGAQAKFGPMPLVDALGRPWFQAIDDDGHAIEGTSSLVSVHTLTHGALLLKELATEGRLALMHAEASLARARHIADACESGAATLRSVLELELQDRSEEAMDKLEAWSVPAKILVPDIVETSQPEETDEFSFADEPTVVRPESSDEAISAELREIFQDEIKESLFSLHTDLKTLGENTADLRALERVERIYHTMKGAAATVGLSAVAELAAALQHDAERAIEEDAKASAELITSLEDRTQALLRAAGIVHAMPKSAPKNGTKSATIVRAIEPAIEPELEEKTSDIESVRFEVDAIDSELWDAFEEECRDALEEIERLVLDLEDASDQREVLQKLMRIHHTLKGSINTIGLGPTGEVLHRVEDFLEHLLALETIPMVRDVVSLLIEVRQSVHRNLDQAKQGFVETSLGRFDAKIERLLAGATAPKKRQAARAPLEIEETVDRRFIRVPAESLDTLMNLAGELVVNRSRLGTRISLLKSIQGELGASRKRLLDRVETFREQHEFSIMSSRQRQARASVSESWGSFSDLELDRYDDINLLSRSLAEISNDINEVYGQLFRELNGFSEDSSSLDGIVSGIQSEVTRARLVPIETLFARLRLPVRDAADREQRQVRVVAEGEQVNVDKTIADALLTPMLHLVRNAVVHGIEPAEVRAAENKDATGLITLVATQAAGQIRIEIKDDGRGLDFEALRARGVAMGLIPADLPISHPSIKELIFAPGVSTSALAGAVSGRGIGCDVVRRSIERMNGSIVVETEAGRGTRFIITLPVTLAITKALLVKNRGQTYAIPLFFTERIFDVRDADVVESMGVRRIHLRGSYLVVRRLDELFGSGPRTSERDAQIVVLRMGEQVLALEVDQVVSQEEIVVKSAGDLLSGHPYFAGVTIRGTGEIVLIADVAGLMQSTAGRVRTDKNPATVVVDPARPVFTTEARPRTKPRVLFVDDSLSVRKVAERTLLALGVDVALAVDGIDALMKLREGEFDLVFTDLEMPRMHGYELIRELRFVPAFKNLPIVVVSSRSGQKHQDQARTLGANDYLTKPFTSESLETALVRWIAQKGRPS